MAKKNSVDLIEGYRKQIARLERETQNLSSANYANNATLTAKLYGKIANLLHDIGRSTEAAKNYSKSAEWYLKVKQEEVAIELWIKAGNLLKKAGRSDEATRAYKSAEQAVEQELYRLEGRKTPSKYRTSNDSYQGEAILKQIEDKTPKKRQGLNKDLTSRLSSFVAIAGVLGGLFFLSSNITGNAIADLISPTSNIIGASLLIIGLVAGFFWIKSRKK